ncbi:MAG: N(4)-(beta-N-acetylglucosaminyl)-L-asparaginase [Thermoanaerobaculia bacterium]
MTLSRRGFLGIGAAAAAGLLDSRGQAAESALSPAPKSAGPVAVASANGLRGVAKAYEMMKDGADPLDAAIAGVNIQELDPEDRSVGLGGLPNEHGVVQLDASCMHGPTRLAGAVGALEDIATPSLVAKAVMDYTDHVFLVGEGAKRFALSLGFAEQDLLTDKSRQDWLRWKARLNPDDDWLDHDDDVKINRTHGTINLCALDADGDLGSVTTTSGLSWKIPGRVGDSPVVGAGQYCDNTVGAAGATGRGEAAIKTCGSFLVVELMRQGMAPEEACLKVLERAVAMTEDRHLDDCGRPRFNLQFYALRKDGVFGGAVMYAAEEDDERPYRNSYAVADAAGARYAPLTALFPSSERPS